MKHISISTFTFIVALVATFLSFNVTAATAVSPADDAGQAAVAGNSATSPYAVSAPKAALRAADPDQDRADSYGLPLEVPAACADKNVIAFNALVIEGHARPEIKALVKGRPLELRDDGITDARLEKILGRAQAAWKKVTYSDCPVTRGDLKCANQQAAALACCAIHFPMPWKKVEGIFLGEKVDGFSLTGKAFEDANGKAVFEVELSNETKLVVIENPESTPDEAMRAVESGNEREVVVPSINIEAENDYRKDYPAYAGYVLEFSTDGAQARLESFKENINFSMNETGVFGVSVVTMTAGSKGIFGSDEPDAEAVFIDEPFRAFVVSRLVDGSDAVIFDVVVNTVK